LIRVSKTVFSFEKLKLDNTKKVMQHRSPNINWGLSVKFECEKLD